MPPCCALYGYVVSDTVACRKIRGGRLRGAADNVNTSRRVRRGGRAARTHDGLYTLHK